MVGELIGGRGRDLQHEKLGGNRPQADTARRLRRQDRIGDAPRIVGAEGADREDAQTIRPVGLARLVDQPEGRQRRDAAVAPA